MAAPKISWCSSWPTLAVQAGRRLRLALPRLFFTIPYFLLVAWFHVVEVYYRHFSTTGPLLFIYNCARVLFIFYLFWMVETVGLALLRAVASKALAEIGHSSV